MSNPQQASAKKWSWSTKNNNLLRTIVILLSFGIIALFQVLPVPSGLTESGMSVIGIFLGSLILWLTVSIDWSSLLAIFLLGFIPEIGFTKIFANSLGNSTFIFLLFTFACTYALSKTPLLKRIAVRFVSSKLAQKSPWFFISTFFFAVIFLGLFISPSVLFVILLPFLEEILTIANIKKGEKVGSMLIMGLGFTVSISSGMTPIAHIFSVMAMDFYTQATGLVISYGDYMLFAVPVGILLTIGMIAMFKFIFKPDVSKLKNIDVSPLKKDLPKISRQEIISLSVFMFVVLLWVLPSIVKDILPQFYTFINGFGTAMPPILGVLILATITDKGKPILSLPDAFKNGVPWAAMIMCAGTLAIAYATTLSSIGLTSYLSSSLSSVLTGIAPFVLMAIFVIWAALQTNVSSNMVTVTVVTTAALPILLALGGGINTASVVSLIGFMGSMAFATPPAMPHIAIVAGSDWSKTSSVLIYGSILMIISIILCIFMGYPIANLVM